MIWSRGIGGRLEDLDNLLEELGEKPAAETPEQPAEAGAIEVAGEPSPAEGEAVFQAAEVPGLEQPSSDDTASDGESVSADVAPVPPQALAVAAGEEQDGAAVEPSRSFPVRILHGLAAPAAGILAIVDIPFARFSPRIKNAVGYLAVGTFVVAIGLWVGGPSLIRLRALTVAASPSTIESEASSASSHSSSAGSKASSAGSHSAATGSKSSGAGSHAPAKKSH